MNFQKVKDAWQELANRSDLVGQEVVFNNRIGDCVDRGTISKIVVSGEFVTIESPEIEAAYKRNEAWSPNIKFKISEERDPCLVGDTIFCDLDDYRQIQIKNSPRI